MQHTWDKMQRRNCYFLWCWVRDTWWPGCGDEWTPLDQGNRQPRRRNRYIFPTAHETGRVGCGGFPEGVLQKGSMMESTYYNSVILIDLYNLIIMIKIVKIKTVVSEMIITTMIMLIIMIINREKYKLFLILSLDLQNTNIYFFVN